MKQKKNSTSQSIVLDITADDTRLQKHGYKLTEQDEKEICLAYMFNRKSYIEAMSKYNISKTAYYNIINKHKKNNFQILDEDINEIRSNFTKKTSVIISKALEQIEKKLDEGEDLNINQLATITGILYDKEALELGKATSNSQFNIHIQVDK